MRILALAFIMSSAVLAGPTFTRDVAPILYKNCVSCHRAGEMAPMSLLEYKSARPWAKAIREAVTTRKMPPWFADERFGHFSNDPRLSTVEIGTIQAWVDSGAPEGDPKQLPAQPVFADGWKLGKPDIVIDIGQDFVVPPGRDRYVNFTVPTNFTEGKWIRAAQILPGDRLAVHHVHVSILEAPLPPRPREETVKVSDRIPFSSIMESKGGLSQVRDDAPVADDGCVADANLPNLSGFQEGSMSAYLPGRQPDVYPRGTAKWVPPGAKFRFQVHYANVKASTTDRTSVGLYLYPGKPEIELTRLDLRNFYFRIPAGAENHEVKRCYDFEADKLLFAITPHMHIRGKDARYELVRPDGRREVLLSVPRYDFNWQLNYQFQEPVHIERGSRLIVTFHYDNSASNQANPDPSRVIRWGDRTEDEMMTTWTEVVGMPSIGTSTESAHK
jgi:hypothetical protein